MTITHQELEQRIRSGIPLTAQMDFRVLALTDNSITVRAGAAENINVHGTAFAGSLYTVCTLALWGLIHSRLPAHAALVMAEGTIRYRKPVVGEIIAHCSIPAEAMETFLETVNATGKSRLKAQVYVADQDHNNAVEFTGMVHARLKAD